MDSIKSENNSESIYSDLQPLSTSLEIDTTDVIKVVEQFLQAQGLHRSLRTLQEETGVATNSVLDKEKFSNNIIEGKWDRVLEEVAYFKLEPIYLYDLFEHIFFELSEMGEFDTARAILYTSPVLQIFSINEQVRFSRMEHILSMGKFDTSLYVTPKTKRRQQIANNLLKHVSVIPENRLLNLLNSALKWERHVGNLPDIDSSMTGSNNKGEYSLLMGSTVSASKTDNWITKPFKSFKMNNKTHANATLLHFPYVFCGLNDGFIEIYDTNTNSLASFTYQNDKKFMLHNSSITALTISNDGDVLISGSANGEIRLWNWQSGELLKKIPNLHDNGINDIKLNNLTLSLLTCGGDGLINLVSLRSGHVLQQFRANQGAVRSVYWVGEKSFISAGADGSLKLWNTTSHDPIKTLFLSNNASSNSESNSNSGVAKGITHLSQHPQRNDVICVSAGCESVFIINANTLTILSTLTVVVQQNTIIPTILYTKWSNYGKYIYGVGSDLLIYVFRVETGKIIHALKPHAQEVLSLDSQGKYLVTAAGDGVVRVWH